MKSASSSSGTVTDKIKEVRGIKVLAHRVDNLERGQMRTLVDQLRDKIGSGVVVLGSATNGNVSLIVGVTKDLTSRVQAGKVIAPVAQKVGGKGGGRPDPTLSRSWSTRVRICPRSRLSTRWARTFTPQSSLMFSVLKPRSMNPIPSVPDRDHASAA